MRSSVVWLIATGFLLYVVVAALLLAFLASLPSHPMLKPIRDLILFALLLLGVVLAFSSLILALEVRGWPGRS